MASSRLVRGLDQSSSSSGIFYQGEGQPSAIVNSHLSQSFANSSNSIQGTGCSDFGPVSGDMNNAVFNSVANSGPSMGVSSLVTDANSALSGGPHLQRSASINTESYMRLPASPMSFNSNNISVSGSSIIDGSCVVQQNSQQDQNTQHVQQQAQHGASHATSLPTSQIGQVSLPMGSKFQGSFSPDPNNYFQVQKKPRLDIKQEDLLQQQVLQQLFQRQDSMQSQNRNSQLQALFQQQRMRQQQQILQSLPQYRAQFQQQQQQIQLRQQLQQQAMQPASPMKPPYDGGVCARRLMQYLYHQRQRPSENSIAYWRKFVTEYYSPRAKKRWCLSLYENVGHHALGVFPQAAMDAWHCDICGSKSGRGFEATFEVLPRLNEIKFGSGVIDELLFLDLPQERRFSSGIMMLEYGKATQESVYEQLRVVREGQLRIIFTQDLKILSWEFCARHHEELLPRRLVAPQVNQLLQVAHKCQSTIAESGPDGVSQKDLQTNSNMVLMAGRQLAKSLELQLLNDLGFSKRYVRCLQISEVVNSMKDLIGFCRDQKVGPIEGLKNYPRHATAAKLQMQKMQEMEQLASIQGVPTDRNTINKMMAMHPELDNHGINNHQMIGRGGMSGSQAALAMATYQNILMRQNSMNSNPSPHQQEASTYQNILMRQNSMNSNPSPHQQEASTSFNNSNYNPSPTLQGTASLMPGSIQNSSVGGYSSAQQPLQKQSQQLQQHPPNAGSMVQQNHHPQMSQGSQAMQQHMIQQLLQMSSNSKSGGGAQQQPLAGQNANRSLGRRGMSFMGNTSVAATSGGNVSGSNAPGPSRSNSFKAAASNSESSAGNCGFNQKASDLQQDLHLSEGVGEDIGQDFPENGFINGELDEDLGYVWKD